MLKYNLASFKSFDTSSRKKKNQYATIQKELLKNIHD